MLIRVKGQGTIEVFKRVGVGEGGGGKGWCGEAINHVCTVTSIKVSFRSLKSSIMCTF